MLSYPIFQPRQHGALSSSVRAHRRPTDANAQRAVAAPAPLRFLSIGVDSTQRPLLPLKRPQLRYSSAPLFARASGGAPRPRTRWNPTGEVEPTNEPRLRLVAAQPTLHLHPLPLWILVAGQRARASAWLQPFVGRRLWPVRDAAWADLLDPTGSDLRVLLQQAGGHPRRALPGDLRPRSALRSHRLPRSAVCAPTRQG